jgi:transposase
MRRCIGLDVHREFAEVAIWEQGIVRSAGQIATTPEALRLFAESLCAYDEVALEATCNTHAIARLLERHVGRVVVSNPTKTRAIAEAKVKTDKVDAQVLAQLLAAGFLPSLRVFLCIGGWLGVVGDAVSEVDAEDGHRGRPVVTALP